MFVKHVEKFGHNDQDVLPDSRGFEKSLGYFLALHQHIYDISACVSFILENEGSSRALNGFVL